MVTQHERVSEAPDGHEGPIFLPQNPEGRAHTARELSRFATQIFLRRGIAQDTTPEQQFALMDEVDKAFANLE